MIPLSPVPPRPLAARVATSAVFFANGAGFASWAVRIPDVQKALRLDDGALGLALFAVAAGSLVAMPAVGGWAARRGSAPVTTALALLFCAAVALPALASSVSVLVLALAALGATNGGLDVAMNAQATAVERAWGAPVMSSFHALYSLGGLLGAAGGALAARHLGPAAHLALVAGLLAATVAVASRHLLAAGADAQESGPFFRRPDRSLAILALLAFCVLVVEGAISDWSAVFMEKVTHAGPSLKAGGLAAFSLAMAAGRFAGDWATRRIGPVRLVRGGGLLAAAGLGAAIVTAHPVVAVAGFACVGAGFAAMFPSLMRAAARSPAGAGAGIAAVATVGYGGFLAGPPLIGLLSRAAGLRAGLGLAVLASVLVASLAGAVGDARRPEVAEPVSPA
jgi:predicted MFS family arabinose efflux permease